MDKPTVVILVLSGLVMLLSLVTAIPLLAAEANAAETDQDAYTEDRAHFFNLARRTSPLEMPGKEDFERQQRAKHIQLKMCTLRCVSCNMEIVGYQFDHCVGGCRLGRMNDNNCLRYLTK